MGNCTELYCTGPTYGQQSNLYVQIREGKPSLSSNILDSRDNNYKITKLWHFQNVVCLLVLSTKYRNLENFVQISKIFDEFKKN